MKTKNVATTAGGLIVGAIGANYVANQAGKMIPAVGKFSGAVPLIVGWFLAGMKNDFAKAAGAGMIAAGGAKLVGGFMPNMGINEDLSENVLTEDLSEDVLTEDLSEDVLTEDMTEDLSEDVLTEDLSEDLA